MTLVWASAFWLGGLFATGFFLGMTNPDISTAEAEKVGEDVAGIYLLIALGASAGLTIRHKKMNNIHHPASQVVGWANFRIGGC